MNYRVFDASLSSKHQSGRHWHFSSSLERPVEYPKLRFQVFCRLALSVTATALPGATSMRNLNYSLERRQDGPVAPDIASECTYYDAAISDFTTRATLEENWNLTFEQFFDSMPISRFSRTSIRADSLRRTQALRRTAVVLFLETGLCGSDQRTTSLYLTGE